MRGAPAQAPPSNSSGGDDDFDHPGEGVSASDVFEDVVPLTYQRDAACAPCPRFEGDLGRDQGLTQH